MISLDGRVALVTGAAAGIGFGIATILARAGARIAINDIDAAPAEAAAERIGGDAFAVPGNVAVETEADAIIAAVLKAADRLDILVNNAGVPPADHWPDIVPGRRVAARPGRQSARHLRDEPGCGKEMIERRRGTIINISSVRGLAAIPGSHAYGVSKAGVAMLTQTLASELAHHKIRVNAVAPGVIAAPMLAKMGVNAERIANIESRVPMGRLGQPDEIGYAVAFLASDLSSYTTGAVLPVDGGWLSFSGVG